MFRAYNVFSMLRPARPRHPMAQALLALVAVCAFLVLLVVGAAIAVVVMMVGLVLRAFGLSRPVVATPNAGPRAQAEAPGAGGDVIDGEFRVVDKSLPHGTL